MIFRTADRLFHQRAALVKHRELTTMPESSRWPDVFTDFLYPSRALGDYDAWSDITPRCGSAGHTTPPFACAQLLSISEKNGSEPRAHLSNFDIESISSGFSGVDDLLLRLT